MTDRTASQSDVARSQKLRFLQKAFKTTTLIGMLLFIGSCGSPQGNQINPPNTDIRAVYPSFFTGKGSYEKFYGEKGPEPLQEKIAGAIVPHHLLVGSILARFYQRISRTMPSTVVIIGPNHFERGHGAILTTDGLYETPYGPVPIDEAIVRSLRQSPLIALDREPFLREHSISAEVGFIARTWPSITIVPIILKANVTAQESEKLGHLLAETLPQDALVIASVDFSHFLPENVADFHDETSLAAIRSFDLPRVMRTEVDSPASLATLLTYLRERGAQKMIASEHSNSTSFTGNPALKETTSHFFLAFGRGAPDHALHITTLFMGDAIFGRGIEMRFRKEGTSLLSSLAGQEDRFLYGSDLRILNLEGPITDLPPIQEAPVTFSFPEKVTKPLLRRLRVNAVLVANNHWMDAGGSGALQTLQTLQTLGITSVGSPTPCIRHTIDAATIGLCAFDDTNHRLDEEAALRTIAEERKMVDRLVVSFHWGTEGRTEPTDRQRTLAHDSIDAGADAVIGHHPHVVEPLEIYRNVPILYSLGNVLFDQQDPSLSSGLAAGIAFSADETRLFLSPLRTTGGTPEPLSGEERTAFFKKFLQPRGRYLTKTEGEIVLPARET